MLVFTFVAANSDNSTAPLAVATNKDLLFIWNVSTGLSERLWTQTDEVGDDPGRQAFRIQVSRPMLTSRKRQYMDSVCRLYVKAWRTREPEIPHRLASKADAKIMERLRPDLRAEWRPQGPTDFVSLWNNGQVSLIRVRGFFRCTYEFDVSIRFERDNVAPADDVYPRD